MLRSVVMKNLLFPPSAGGQENKQEKIWRCNDHLPGSKQLLTDHTSKRTNSVALNCNRTIKQELIDKFQITSTPSLVVHCLKKM